MEDLKESGTGREDNLKKHNSIYWKCFSQVQAARLLKVLDTADIIVQHRGETGRLIDSRNWSVRGPYPGYKKDQEAWIAGKTLGKNEYFVIRTP